MEKSQKISLKIEFISTCPNSSMSPEGTLGPLGVKFLDYYMFSPKMLQNYHF